MAKRPEGLICAKKCHWLDVIRSLHVRDRIRWLGAP
jgi:hypothetical protein